MPVGPEGGIVTASPALPKSVGIPWRDAPGATGAAGPVAAGWPAELRNRDIARRWAPATLPQVAQGIARPAIIWQGSGRIIGTVAPRLQICRYASAQPEDYGIVIATPLIDNSTRPLFGEGEGLDGVGREILEHEAWY